MGKSQKKEEKHQCVYAKSSMTLHTSTFFNLKKKIYTILNLPYDII